MQNMPNHGCLYIYSLECTFIPSVLYIVCSMTTSDIDKFFSYVGVLGRYQKEQWLWFTYCMVGVAYPILIYIFAGKLVECHNPL